MAKKKAASKKRKAAARRPAKPPRRVSYPGQPVWPGDEEPEAPEAPAELARRHAEEEAGEPEGFDEKGEPHNFGDRQDDEELEIPEGDEPRSELRLGDDKPPVAWRRKTKGER